MKGLGLYSLVKPLIMYTVSFFVLVTAAKAGPKGLKQFGKIIATVLIIMATLLVACTVYCSLTGTGCSSKKSGYKKMMGHGMRSYKGMECPKK